jgi:hypothetical protein
MMPIGVPKVAYRVPGSQSADWYVVVVVVVVGFDFLSSDYLALPYLTLSYTRFICKGRYLQSFVS